MVNGSQEYTVHEREGGGEKLSQTLVIIHRSISILQTMLSPI